MSDIEQKALALVNEVLAEWGVKKNAVEIPKNSDAFARALLRAIEQHEAFRQEVSDAVEQADLLDIYGKAGAYLILQRFIIPKPKPDPLVEAMVGVGLMPLAADLRAALDKLGFEIREKNDD